mgnify:CR=1 FL=1|tara:strand:+ start:23929 stop:25068 length:1140 start_codon:yes stop_codon:yes gene_type:complete
MINSLQLSKELFNKYILNLIDENSDIKFAHNIDQNIYSLCFGIHSLFLVQDKKTLNKYKQIWIKKILYNLKNNQLNKNEKPFLQLLSLSISSLIMLDSPKHQLICDLCIEVVTCNTEEYLDKIGVNIGKPGSGNLAMFLAIFYIYLENYYGYDFKSNLSKWKNYHDSNKNKYGLWGQKENSKNLQYSTFQNGYHQYEIYNFLNIEIKNKANLVSSIISLSDKRGQFSPYPGGGGCYDYDAVYLLTMFSDNDSYKTMNILDKTFNSIIKNQNKDGGFGESAYIRPLSFKNLLIQFFHISILKPNGLYERINRFVALLRPKHNLIKTHWSQKKRSWNESNIFNSWFRMMTLARIDIYRDKSNKNNWGFMSFPGIGFHEKKS